MFLSEEQAKLRIDYLNKQIDSLPEGHLYERTTRGKTYSAIWIKSYPKNSKYSHRYFSTSRSPGKELAALALKRSTLVDEVNTLLMQIGINRETRRRISVVARRGEPVKMDYEFFCKLKKTEDTNTYPKPKKCYEYKGILFRSKSEQVIAEYLDKMGYPYSYESRLTMGNKTVYPDFSVYLPEIDKVIFIEFMGRMDDRDYILDAGERFKFYGYKGFMVGRDVIFICETDKSAFDTGMLNIWINALIMANTEVAK